ncbi:MAG TPA: type I-U CRISPR-associated protein Csb2 [Vicinamibacterales bacterium]
MLALAVELLSGRYVATAYNDRDRAEWPPHPARLFSALVAAWAEGGEAADEAAALDWLAGLPAPSIVASASKDVAMRTVVPVFVPVNDVAVVNAPDPSRVALAERALADADDARARARAERDLQKARGKLAADMARATAVPTRFTLSDVGTSARLFPERRTRQPRTFPSVTPLVPRVAYVWDDAVPDRATTEALARLLGRVARLGHSSSLVHALLPDAEKVAGLEANSVRFVPDPDAGELVLRWVAADQRRRLVEAFDRHHETEPRVLPATFVRYREGARPAQREIPSSVFGADWIVFARVGGARLTSVSAAGVARQFRRALMAAADQPVAEILSGHQPDGTPGERPHAAIVPLPHVAAPHADGSLLGLAIVLPREASTETRQAVVRAVARLEAAQHGGDDEEAPPIALLLGSAGVLELQRVVWGEHRSVGLQGGTWCRPARHWATATPLALDRNPGDLHDPDPVRRAEAYVAATETVVQSLQRIGLPEPLRVDVLRSAVLPGTVKPRQFPPFPGQPGRPQRVLVHVRLEFAVPVRGPIIAGAGRYYGLGLFRPVDGGRRS